MSEEKHEALSALIDGELAEDKGGRMVDEVLADASLTKRWSTYHLIGEVMRRQSHGLRLDQGPGGAAVTPISSAGRRGPAIRPVAGLALAASVALAAVIGIYAVSTPAPELGQIAKLRSPPSPAAAQPPVQTAAEASSSVVQVRSPEPQRVVTGSAAIQRLTWNDAEPGVANRLNGYLVNHNEYLANGMRGMLPYARIVAYDSAQ